MSGFKFFSFIIGILTIGCFPAIAHAHSVNTDVSIFYAGMLHPLTSVEHLLSTLALVLIASQFGRRAGRFLMWMFPLALIVGIMIGSRFITFDLAHPANLLALGLLGVLLIVVHRVNLRVVIAAAWIIGLILGYRSGVDMANANADLKFMLGVGLTGFIAVVLFSAWVPKAAARTAITLRTMAGVCFAGAGLFMLGKLLFAGDTAVIRNVGLPTEESLTALVKAKELTLPVLIGSLFGASVWGAAHSLTPGHGKAIVAAYLVGARSTPWHALYLGVIVTATHTLGVFTLGVITLFASKYIIADQLYPWLGAVSGFIVLALGVSMFVTRIRSVLPQKHRPHIHHDDKHSENCDEQGAHVHDYHNHDHDHGHAHFHLPPGADDSSVTWRSILCLGISGGLLPCPAALVLLLTAVSLQRVGFGMVLVGAFSLGLAVVLVAVGLLFVKGSSLINKTTGMTALSRYLPMVSALLISVLGLLITIDSIAKIGV